jgi:sarcosine oxidase subunit gamma
MNIMNDQFASSSSIIEIRQLPPEVRISLRVGDADRGEVGRGLGLGLPGRIGDVASAGDRRCLCLGPDEWMLETSEADRRAIIADLSDIRSRVALSAVDLSDREIVYRLRGRVVIDLLATGCPLDLEELSVGSGTRTLFDTVQVVLVRREDEAFDLSVWRSFAPHVLSLLELATAELAAGL